VSLRQRTVWTWRLRLYPMVAASLAVIVFNAAPARVADGVAAIPSVDDATAKAQSGAAPSSAASPHEIVWSFERGPLIEFRTTLTWERR